ncbi:hypothetical protein GCM10009430_24320 [Aquimarina litoralis]|uniref:Uncharacterized protein n=1 Tax=Aquimarina litoralis TaxID=584605 RepID=A0ABN1IVI4_9FLAO
MIPKHPMTVNRFWNDQCMILNIMPTSINATNPSAILEYRVFIKVPLRNNRNNPGISINHSPTVKRKSPFSMDV